jgi:bifunctional oligoribonuclease and PAP phosphatase NrnA
VILEGDQIIALKEFLAERSKIVITTHVNPDGDAIGSTLGLYHFLKDMGHEVFPIVPNEYPKFLHWLPGNKEIIDHSRHKNRADKIISEADFIFMLDYNDAKRNDINLGTKAKKILIDHHPYPSLKADFLISTTKASSTAELIYEFIQAVDGLKYIDKTVATCIYTGIMTDTGCFSYNSSRTRTFEIVSKLLNYAIEKDEIYGHVYDNFSSDRIRLLGYCLNEKMQVFPEYKTALISINREEQKRYNFMTGDSEGFVNYPLSIKDIRFSAFFMERKDKIKISFRSRGNFPVNIFSEKHFSGGGHANASGGESALPLEETIKKFIDLLPLYSKELKS